MAAEPIELEYAQARANVPGAPLPMLDLARQQRNLLLMRPLYELALRSRREGNEALWSGLDTNYLCLCLLVFVMDGGALGQGRTHDEAVEHVAELARRMKPALASEQAQSIGREVIEALHNAANHGQPFAYPYFDAAGARVRTHSFALLRYARSDLDDAYYYRVTDEGFVVYLGVLDFGAADMQVLMEKMLHEFIRRGNIDQALEASQRALYESRRYLEQISAQLLRAHRVPDAVRWSTDVAPRLDEARRHIDARLTEEHQMLQATRESLANAADANTREKFVRLRETVEASLTTSARLLQVLGEAAERFRNAARTLFRTRKRYRLPNLEEVVLPQMLQSPVAALDTLADEESYRLLGLDQPRLYELDSLFTTLLTARGVADDTPAPEGALVPLAEELPHFAQADVQAAEVFLAQQFAAHPQTDIAQLLQAADQAGLGAPVRQYMTFLLYRAFSREESPFPVETTVQGRFDSVLVAGARLVFAQMSS